MEPEKKVYNYKKNGVLAKFYKASYDTKVLPVGFCDYFWKLFKAVVCLPLTFPSYILPNNSEPLGKRCGTGFAMWFFFLLFMAPGLVYAAPYETGIWYLMWSFIYSVGFIVFLMALGGFFALLSAGCMKLREWKDKERVKLFKAKFGDDWHHYYYNQNHVIEKPKTENMLVTAYKAYKEKKCPMINWED